VPTCLCGSACAPLARLRGGLYCEISEEPEDLITGWRDRWMTASADDAANYGRGVQSRVRDCQVWMRAASCLMRFWCCSERARLVVSKGSSFKL